MKQSLHIPTTMLVLVGTVLGMLTCSNALMATRTPTQRASMARISALQATTTKEVVYDGPEWTSIQDCLGAGRSDYGKMTVAVGESTEGGKIVGVVTEDDTDGVPLKGSNLQVYPESVAKLANVNDQDAINTMIAALAGIQCAMPRVEGVGGANGETNGMVSGKVVILGGSEYACFAAEGLAALGSQVSLVSTNKVSVKNGNVDVLPPAVGDEEIGFASYVGEFDSLLDTADDERPSKRFYNDDDGGDDKDRMMSMGPTLRLLKQQHKCERYVSSMTKAQSIVNSEGVFFGPGKVKSHVATIQQQLASKPATFASIVPPPSFGKTVETLLSKGIVYKNNKDFLTANNNLVLRGWSLKNFMETSTWPTDTSGGGGSRMVRYGLPVVEEVEEDFGFDMISAPPETAKTEFIERDVWDADIQKEQKERDDKDSQNPYVKKIVGEQGMYDTIVREKRDCVLFLSAAFCRTCKSLNPRFTTLARQTMASYGLEEDDGYGILFAKADASGEVGKDLSRLLNVDSVPAFLLFRNGRRYGPALAVSRMPSKKLDAAIDMLESGVDWDAQAMQNAEERQ